MKAVKIILLVITGIIVAVLALVFIGGYYLSKQPSVPTDFETSVQTGGDVEASYLAKGAHEVSYLEQEAEVEDYGKYEIYYPAELAESDKVYPVLVVVNGTGVPASKDKVMARITDAAHEQTLYRATGYVTAWFMWQLQGDEEAAKAFAGDEAELLNNSLYQDVQIDIN